MTATMLSMEFLPVDKVPAYTLEKDDYINVDNEIVLVQSIIDNDDTVIIQYLDDYDELGEIEIGYDIMMNIYMLFD